MFSNSPKGLLRGEGLFVLDLSLTKTIPLGRDRRLQLRVDAFNATNHTNFGIPNVSFGSPAFGTIATTRPARTLQLTGRHVF